MTVPTQVSAVQPGVLHTQWAWTDVTGLQVNGSVHAGGVGVEGVDVGEPPTVPPPKLSRVVVSGPKAASPIYPP